MLLYLILLFLPITIFGQDYTSESGYRALNEGATYYILKNETSVHAAPFVTAATVALLPVGFPVKIEERTEELLKIHGFRTNWYRVSFDNNGYEEGFVWGGHLAVGALVGKDNPNLLFLYGIDTIKLVQRGDYIEESICLQLNISENCVLKNKLNLEAVGTLYTNTQGEAFGNSGVPGVEEVLEIAFSDGYCGGVSAAITVFWDGKNLHKVDLLTNGFGSEYFSNNFFIYPSSEDGKEGLILLREEEGNYDVNKIPRYFYQKDSYFEWNGTKLIEVLR